MYCAAACCLQSAAAVSLLLAACWSDFPKGGGAPGPVFLHSICLIASIHVYLYIMLAMYSEAVACMLHN
jgi:hypothetical protein